MLIIFSADAGLISIGVTEGEGEGVVIFCSYLLVCSQYFAALWNVPRQEIPKKSPIAPPTAANMSSKL